VKLEEQENVIKHGGEAAESTVSPTKRKILARCERLAAEAYEGNLYRRLKSPSGARERI
jgi:hypothetical protein